MSTMSDFGRETPSTALLFSFEDFAKAYPASKATRRYVEGDGPK